MDHWELIMDWAIFRQIVEHFQVYPTLDAFFSAETAQLPCFMTWIPDGRVVARNALEAAWNPVTYVFPPVPMMLKVLHQIREQGIKAILIYP